MWVVLFERQCPAPRFEYRRKSSTGKFSKPHSTFLNFPNHTRGRSRFNALIYLIVFCYPLPLTLPNSHRKWAVLQNIDHWRRVAPYTPMHSLLDWSCFCSDVMCPICMGIISDALTIVECMHRFCAECIKQVALHQPHRHQPCFNDASKFEGHRPPVAWRNPCPRLCTDAQRAPIPCDHTSLHQISH